MQRLGFNSAGPLATARRGRIALVPAPGVTTTVCTVSETKVATRWNHSPAAPPRRRLWGFLLTGSPGQQGTASFASTVAENRRVPSLWNNRVHHVILSEGR